MKRCPICRGRTNETHICTRCGANLSQLIEISSHHDDYCYLCMEALYQGKDELAFQHANQAFKLKQSPLSKFLFSYLVHNS